MHAKNDGSPSSIAGGVNLTSFHFPQLNWEDSRLKNVRPESEACASHPTKSACQSVVQDLGID